MVIRLTIQHRPQPSQDSSQWPRAFSSLTVARQRGILTRFPVFTKRQRRAFRKNLTKIKTTVRRIYSVKEGKSNAPPEWREARSVEQAAPTPQPRSGERVQPTAQAVGCNGENGPAPEGRKKRHSATSFEDRSTLTVSTFPPNTTKSTTPHSPPPMSPTENKPHCSSRDKRNPPATSQAANSSVPRPSARPPPSLAPHRERSTLFQDHSYARHVLLSLNLS